MVYLTEFSNSWSPTKLTVIFTGVRGHLLVALGYGLWSSMVLISEIVQTFSVTVMSKGWFSF